MVDNKDSLLTLTNYEAETKPAILDIRTAQSDDEFDEALELLLEQVLDRLEREANLFSHLDEESLTAILRIGFTNTEIRASREDYTKGHVDITFESNRPPIRRRLGEAKIYNGPAYHVQGVKQLIGRYSTGREGSGIVIEYVKKPKIKVLVEKIRKHMDREKPCEQDGDSKDHRIKWSFTTEHVHSSGELLRVLHLSCNLHISENK